MTLTSIVSASSGRRHKSLRIMILAPSEIHFLRDAGSESALTPDENTLADLSSRFSDGDEQIPKVQVTEKDGSWFALNNSYLHIVRDLERRGKCARIHVEVVPLTKVPKSLQKGMICQPLCEDSRENNWTHNCPATSHECETPDTDDTSSYTTSSEYSEDGDEEISGSESDDNLICNVCDRSFSSTRLLSQHQQRKRHFGCSVCDSCFPNVQGLEMHKETLDHWSDEDGNTYESDEVASEDENQQAANNGSEKEAERLL